MGDRSFGIVQPLVVMSISDHYTRFRYISQDLKAKVAGVLLGTRNAEEARVFNAFETKVDLEGGSIDKEFTQSRLDSYKEMFPDWEFLGWYSTDLELYDQAKMPEPLHRLQKEFASFSTGEDPLYLQMCTAIPDKSVTKRHLPFVLYEGGADGFKRCSFIVEPLETERIALEDAHRDISGATDKSMVGINVKGTLDALTLLKKNLIQIVKVSEAVRNNP